MREGKLSVIVCAYSTLYPFMLILMERKTAFLHGSLKEDMYVCQPKGFIDADHRSHVYKLKKALYGLKQRTSAIVNQSPSGILINQFNHVLEILKKYGMDTCDPIGTSMEEQRQP
ncbi:retrovirus-related pol polyprotein from transposon TNT 1-94 [Tanacetum coccineum]